MYSAFFVVSLDQCRLRNVVSFLLVRCHGVQSKLEARQSNRSFESLRAAMNGAWRRLLGSVIQSRNVSSQPHNLRRVGDGPSETLKQKLAEMERRRKRRKKDEAVLVAVPESMKYLDTATLPMTLTFVAIAVAAKLLMMYEYDETRSQERIERQIKEAPKDQGTVRMLSREEWEEVREVRPRTPFESKLARPNARIRTGEPLRSEDVKDWTIDVLTDALTRVEESVRHGSS